MQTDYLGLSVGIIGILIGIIASYYFYRKSLKIKEPCWSVRSSNLIQDYSTKVEQLKILYKDEPVENLTISRVLFWNNGSDTIDGSDIKTANPLKIVGAENVNILDSTIIASNNASSQIKAILNKAENSIPIEFDYLDDKQGAVIQIIHTGKTSEDIKVIGDIKGVKKLQHKFPNPKWARIIKSAKITSLIPAKYVAVFSVLLGIIYIVGSVISFMYPDSPFLIRQATVQTDSRTSQTINLVFLSFMGFLTAILGIYLWRMVSVAPKGLESFSEEFGSK